MDEWGEILRTNSGAHAFSADECNDFLVEMLSHSVQCVVLISIDLQ